MREKEICSPCALMYHVYPLVCSTISDRTRTHQWAPKKSSITTVVSEDPISPYILYMFLTLIQIIKKIFSHVHLSWQDAIYKPLSSHNPTCYMCYMNIYLEKCKTTGGHLDRGDIGVSLAIDGRVSSRTGSTRCPLRKRNAVRNNVPTNTVPSRRHGTNWQADEKLQLVDGEMAEGWGSNPRGSRPSLTQSRVLVWSHAFSSSRLRFSPSVTI